jgi:hypothetical protein
MGRKKQERAGNGGYGLFGTNWMPSLFKDDREIVERNKGEMAKSMTAKARTRGEVFQGGDAAKRERNRRRNKAARKARRVSRRG